MANVIVIGSQWGDEGKGKLVDILAKKAGLVVRFQGGNNAGHTVMFGENTFALHLIPSGILQRSTTCVIGNGLVVDPEELLKEMDTLKELGVDCAGRLFVSDAANLIMPYHKLIDKAREGRLKNNKIGTTGRGIGPAYEDKAGRIGIRFADVENNSVFKEKLDLAIRDKNLILQHVLNYEGPFLNENEVFEKLMEHHKRIRPFICDTAELIAEEMEGGCHVLFEGAQGTFLDIDHGTYPYVTSSNTVASGACSGSGIGPVKIDAVLGVVKAYTTRVGEGPFPTELLDNTGKFLGKEGHEFGTTTGRPRRCGWLDTCLLKRSIRLNSLTHLAITKLDVLDKLETINICVGYKDTAGKEYTILPNKQALQTELTPIYQEYPGWQTSTTGITDKVTLPEKAIAYLNGIERLAGIPIVIISTGPKREETIILEELF